MNTTPKIRLDWKAYFEAFCAAHGQWPVVHRGVLLFPDGWTYSQNDHMGPEWPPPDDPNELRALQRAYWLRRRAIVRQDHLVLRERLAAIKDIQANKSVPLQQRTAFVGDDGRKAKRTEAINMDGLELKLQWLAEDMARCEAELKQLENDHESYCADVDERRIP